MDQTQFLVTDACEPRQLTLRRLPILLRCRDFPPSAESRTKRLLALLCVLLGRAGARVPKDILVDVARVPSSLGSSTMPVSHDAEVPRRNGPGFDATVNILKRKYRIEVKLGVPRVAYRETLARPAEVDYTHKKPAGPKGAFSRVKLLLEPNEPGAGRDARQLARNALLALQFGYKRSLCLITTGRRRRACWLHGMSQATSSASQWPQQVAV